MAVIIKPLIYINFVSMKSKKKKKNGYKFNSRTISQSMEESGTKNI